MERVRVIQEILNKIKGRNYLEIGVANGDTFTSIDAMLKIGVDPGNPSDKIKEIIGDNINYFQMKSDDFFKNSENIPYDYKIDVVFIDGLHEFKQVIRDVENCLKYLNKRGVIILHDCNPFNEITSIPANSYEEAKKKAISKGLNWTGAWNGDVWKAIVYLRSKHNDLNIFTFDCDCGLGIITKGKPECILDYSFKDIESMTYDDLKLNRKKFLNFKELDFFQDFLRDLSFLS
ncbi:MAG: class I SAM-dependent methyltransferase [Nanoarchaeota archaeon]|nr:class I SAM-dependent methyltransferase [Nanoarchaeota archaeon]